MPNSTLELLSKANLTQIASSQSADDAPLPDDYVCGRACAIESLTPEQKATVQAAAQASSTVVASAAAVAVATAGAPAAVPLAFVLQRAVLLTNVGGAPTKPMLAAVGEEMQWVQGRIGIFAFAMDSSDEGGSAAAAAGERRDGEAGTGDSTRRRLSPGGGGGSGGSGARGSSGAAGGGRKKAEAKLRRALLTSVTDMTFFMTALAATHGVIIYCWHRCKSAPRKGSSSAHTKRSSAMMVSVAHPSPPPSPPPTPSPTACTPASPTRSQRRQEDDSMVSRDVAVGVEAREDSTMDVFHNGKMSAAATAAWAEVPVEGAPPEVASEQQRQTINLVPASVREALAGVGFVREVEVHHVRCQPSDGGVEHLGKQNTGLTVHRWLADEKAAAAEAAPDASQGAHKGRAVVPGAAPARVKSKRSLRRANREAAWKQAEAASSSNPGATPKSPQRPLRVKRLPETFEWPNDPKPLPDALIWPNPEVMLLGFFAGGLTEAAASVIAASAAGVVRDDALVALAAICLILVVFFYVHEALRLVAFSKHHRHDVVRFRSPSVSSRHEMDDPLLKTMTRLRLVKPSLRIRGQLEPPEADVQEPKRTIRHLEQPCGCGLRIKGRTGDDQARLYNWLVDASSTTSGLFYQYLRSFTSALVAFIVGLGSAAGKGTHGIALSLIAVQGGVAAFCFFSSAPGDRLEGQTSGVELAAGALNVLLLYLSAQTTMGLDAASGNAANATAEAINATTTVTGNTYELNVTVGGMGNVSLGTPLQDMAFLCALLAMVLPIALNVYDSIFMRCLEVYEEGSPEARKSGFAFFCLRNLFVTPVVVAAALVSGASQLGAAAELIENTADNSIETIQSKQDKREAAEEDMVDLSEYECSVGRRKIVDTIEIV